MTTFEDLNIRLGRAKDEYQRQIAAIAKEAQRLVLSNPQALEQAQLLELAFPCAPEFEPLRDSR
jgi:hypothetical protein